MVVASLPHHTPYDGSSKPFTVGLKPLELSRWLEVDEHRDAYLAEKRRLYDEMPDKVFVAEEGTQAAQQEVLELVAAYLAENFPELTAGAPSTAFGGPPPPLRRGGPTAADGRKLDPPPFTGEGDHGKRGGGGMGAWLSAQPLHAASLLVQEDLILMRRDESGWRLVAGSLCFPSSWSLQEKFGKPLHVMHEPVPGFGPGTRLAEIINRMFDGLQGQAVERYNWSIQANDALYHPLSNTQRIDRATNRPSKFPDGDIDAHAFIRVERQTLRKLPVARDVLFTIGIHLDPLKVLVTHPDRAALAASFAEQLGALDQAQLDYKGLTADRDRLVERLREMSRD